MKAYRLSAWPDLDGPYQRIGYRRMVSDMSQRCMTLAQLAAVSGHPRHEVRSFLQMLEARGCLSHRDHAQEDSLFDSLRPLGGWLRRALTAEQRR